jgi:hypothetical protein
LEMCAERAVAYFRDQVGGVNVVFVSFSSSLFVFER